MSFSSLAGKAGGKVRKAVALAAALAVAVVFSFAAGTGAPPASAAEPGPVLFQEAPEELPPAVEKWAESKKAFQGIHRFHEGDKTWVMVAWGEKPTGGYGVKVNNARRGFAGVIVLDVGLSSPGPDDIVIQAITYPYDLIVFDRTDALVAAEFDGGTWAPRLETGGIPAASTAIFVDSPGTGARVGDTIVIRAAARFFEGTYRIIVEDGHNILASHIGTATAGGPEWGVIDVALEYDRPTSPHGLMIFYWEDAEDPADGETDLWRSELAVPISFDEFDTGGVVLKDIAGHWARQAIMDAVADGFVNGYPDETFKPDNDITRAEFLKMIMASLGMEPESAHQSPFEDTEDHWARGYIDTAVRRGILKTGDYPGGRYEPDGFISRLEMTKYAVRAAGGEDTKSLHAHRADGFADGGGLTDEAKGYIGAAVTMGIIKGYEDGTVRADGTATRAESVTVVQRTVAAAGGNDGTR